MKQNNKLNIIFTDFSTGSDWPFLKALNFYTSQSWETANAVSNRPRKSRLYNIYRIFVYFSFPLWILVRYSCRISKVLAVQQFYGLNMAFWLRLYHIGAGPSVFVSTFIYKPKSGLIGFLYKKYVSYCVGAKNVKKIFVFSQSEVNTYSKEFPVAGNKFEFIKFGIESCCCNDIIKGNYVFSVGRSNRDYGFLCSALANTPYQVIIATDDDLKCDAPNIDVRKDCFGKNMLNIMAKAFCVVIPLDSPQISSGQLAVIQSMYYGKPVIATYSQGLIDYVQNGINGILINKTQESLLAAIDHLRDDSDYYEKISKNAYKTAKSDFSVSAMVVQIANVINENSAG